MHRRPQLSLHVDRAGENQHQNEMLAVVVAAYRMVIERRLLIAVYVQAALACTEKSLAHSSHACVDASKHCNDASSSRDIETLP